MALNYDDIDSISFSVDNNEKLSCNNDSISPIESKEFIIIEMFLINGKSINKIC